jgi:hypothetical protein
MWKGYKIYKILLLTLVQQVNHKISLPDFLSIINLKLKYVKITLNNLTVQ